MGPVSGQFNRPSFSVTENDLGFAAISDDLHISTQVICSIPQFDASRPRDLLPKLADCRSCRRPEEQPKTECRGNNLGLDHREIPLTLGSTKISEILMWFKATSALPAKVDMSGPSAIRGPASGPNGRTVMGAGQSEEMPLDYEPFASSVKKSAAGCTIDRARPPSSQVRAPQSIIFA